MASRMERYYKTEERSKKNEHLYQKMNELSNYTNIEGVADISNSNEINISMVKEMLNSREDYQKRRNYQELMEQKKNIEKVIPEDQEEKNYDLLDILNKAKIDHSDSDSRYRSLKNSQYDILKSIKVEDKEVEPLEKEEPLPSEALSDDLGMFDDLKSNTTVGDAESIKKVLEEAKKDNDKPIVETVTSNNLDNIDKTFYSSSFSFSDKDFEDIRNLDNSLQKNNKLMKVLIVVFSVLIAIVVLFVIGRLVL